MGESILPTIITIVAQNFFIAAVVQHIITVAMTILIVMTD